MKLPLARARVNPRNPRESLDLPGNWTRDATQRRVGASFLLLFDRCLLINRQRPRESE